VHLCICSTTCQWQRDKVIRAVDFIVSISPTTADDWWTVFGRILLGEQNISPEIQCLLWEVSDIFS